MARPTINATRAPELAGARVVVLAGGTPHAHNFEASGRAIADLLTDAGGEVTMVEHPDALPAVLSHDVDALMVHGLWWTMAGSDYEPWREFEYHTSNELRASIDRFVSAGGGLVASHTAVICFDDWPEWGAITGGAWQWGVSSHPPLGPVTASIVGAHPATAGLESEFELLDEVYGALAMQLDVSVLATATSEGTDDEQPVVWTHTFNTGRVVVDCLGHDVASLTEANHAALLRQAAAWVSRGDHR